MTPLGDREEIVSHRTTSNTHTTCDASSCFASHNLNAVKRSLSINFTAYAKQHHYTDSIETKTVGVMTN